MRRRVQDVVVACPPSMVDQWKDELETRFGLTFEVLDPRVRERVRQERGFGVNPWTTFHAFMVSHALLVDESYVAPLRDWLDDLRARRPSDPGRSAQRGTRERRDVTPSTRRLRGRFARSRRGSSTGCSSRRRRTTATPTASLPCLELLDPSGSVAASP